MITLQDVTGYESGAVIYDEEVAAVRKKAQKSSTLQDWSPEWHDSDEGQV